MNSSMKIRGTAQNVLKNTTSSKKLGLRGGGVSFQYADAWGRFSSHYQTAVSCFSGVLKGQEELLWVSNEWDKTDELLLLCR